jgi:hypothetical protein
LKQYVIDDQRLSSDNKQDLTSKVDALLATIEEESKSTGWKMRAVMGTKRRWYNPVETTQTVGEFGIWKLRESK